jgi:hypothetical protein
MRVMRKPPRKDLNANASLNERLIRDYNAKPPYLELAEM